MQRRAGRFHALGQLLALIDEVIEHGLGSERCAPRMFGVFSIEAPPAPGQLPVLRVLAIGTSAQVARTAAAARV